MTTLDKRRATLAVAIPAVLVFVLSLLPWARGSAPDVFTVGTVEVTGNSITPAGVGLVIIAVVSLLALMTGGRVIKALAAGVMLLAALGALVLVLLAVTRPAAAVGREIARQLGRSNVADATGTSTTWAWLALLAALLLVLGAVLTALSSRTWAGLSSRYERADRPASGPRGEVRTAWDEITEGGDPTETDGPDPTDPDHT